MKRKRQSVDIIFNTDAHEIIKGRDMAVKAMKEIVPIFKDHFEKATKSIDTSKLSDKELFSIFMDEIRSLNMKSNDSRFAIRYHESGGYFYIENKVFDDYDGSTLYAVSISALPELKQINKPFHDFICCVLNILDNGDISIINGSYYCDWEVEQILELISENNASSKLVKEYSLYEKYSMYYIKLISDSTYSYDKAIDLLTKANLPLSLHESALNWLTATHGLSLLEWSIDEIAERAKEYHLLEHDISEEELSYNGYPVTIDQVFRVLWFNDEDYTNSICSALGETEGNFGEIYPNTIVQCRTKEDFESSRECHLKNYENVPAMLKESFLCGSRLFSEITEYVNNNKKCKNVRKNSKCQLSLQYTTEKEDQVMTQDNCM